jgi:HAD superfamily hydrolase (TIGR01509 family)
MDGVLVDNSPFHREAWRRLCREEGVPLDDPGFWRRTIGRPVEEAVTALLGPSLSPAEVRRLAARRNALYHELAQGRTAEVPGVGAFVRALHAAGIPRALATSADPASVAAVLAATGLGSAFPVRVTAVDVRRGKPDPEVYREAAARLGVPPGACVAFEDAVAGIEAARRAGMAVVGVATAYPAPELAAAGAALVVPDFAGVTWEAVAGLRPAGV